MERAQGPSLDIAEEPVCPLCGGAGFVRRARPVDHPRFGKAEPCECVLNEETGVRRARLERISNLGSLTRFAFTNLIPAGRAGQNDYFLSAFNAAKTFADDPKGWLVFSGGSGSGKTHLAAAIANERIARGQAALFMVVPDLLDHLRASYDATVDELGYEQIFDQVRNAPLLILDDIDASSGTPWAREKLFQIVNHRYNAELPTVYTTSQRPVQLDDRLSTRLTDSALSRVLVLEGPVKGGYRQVGGMSRERLEEMQFRDFLDPPKATPEELASLRSAILAAKDFADGPGGWLVILGANGCGKTHLAAAIANKVLANGGKVFFAVVPDLLDHLRTSFAPGNEASYDETFDEVRSADLLILDDLGAQKSSPWAEEKLYQIVNYRTLMQLPTVVTTDVMPESMRSAYPRIAARVLDPLSGNKIEILAPHYTLGRAASGPLGGARPRKPPGSR